MGEVDAAAALDQLLDLEHDAAVIGPGLRPGLSTVDLVLDFLSAGRGAGAGRRRRRGSQLALDRRGLVGASRAALRADAARRRADAPDGSLPATASRPITADLTRPTTRPARRPPRARRSPGARSSCSRALARSSPAASRIRTAVAVAPYENPALATAGTGDVLAGTIGALLAQGCPPVDAARSGRLPARSRRRGRPRAVRRHRRRGLRPARRDRPRATPARARAAERARSGRRLGFDVGATARRSPDAASGRSGAHRGATIRAPIEARLAAAGLPPLPRLAWLEIDQDALSANVARHPPPGRPASRASPPSSRPTATATAWRSPHAPSWPAAPACSAWPRSTRPSPCARPASRRPSSCSIPSRPRRRPRLPCRASSSSRPRRARWPPRSPPGAPGRAPR